MNTETQLLNLPRIAKACVTTAIRRMEARGFSGEALRARMTRDSTEKHVISVLEANRGKLSSAPLLRVVRSGRAFAYQVCLMAEIGNRK